MGSTKGTDLQALIDYKEAGKLVGVDISLIISNKEDAFILERARNHNLTAIFLDPKDKDREEYDRALDNLLVENKIDLIVLIGYMKLMSSWFVQKWLNKVMNIHPSLLPLYAGGMDKSVHQAVLDDKRTETGASLIFIDEGADTGPIILQDKCSVAPDDTAESLKEKVQKIEGDLIIKGIELYRDDKISVQGKEVIIK